VSEDNDHSPEIDQLVQQIGARIRALRAKRGMIRKHLSKHSGISERYLAKAESGQANISIALLWRVAQALQVRLIDLLPETEISTINSPLQALLRGLSGEDQEKAFELLKSRFSKPAEKRYGVALIGLRGAGKSRLGSLLADEFKVPFVRLSQVIEDMAGMNTGELFSLGGQKAYRRTERQALEHVRGHYPTAVLEVGGSLVSQPDTLGMLLDAYYTVWVKASPEEHMKRVAEQGDMRPMAGNTQAMDDLQRILSEREPEYRLADYVLDTSGRSVLDCLKELSVQCAGQLRQP
jgi:XRE family aerobic/anaerobic benzoate catabolism transcriptional regulator